jgi:hypothetical protein
LVGLIEHAVVVDIHVLCNVVAAVGVVIAGWLREPHCHTDWTQIVDVGNLVIVVIIILLEIVTTVGIVVEQGAGPPHHSLWTSILRVGVWIVVVVVILVGISTAVAVVILGEVAPVLRPVGAQVEVILDAVAVVVWILMEVVAAVAVQIDVLAHVSGWARVVLVGIGIVVVVQVLSSVTATVGVVVGVNFGCPIRVAELTVIFVVEHAIAVIIVPIGLVNEVDENCLAGSGLGLGGRGDANC